MTSKTRGQLSLLALDLRRQARQLETYPGEHGDHVHGMREGLLLAAVQVQLLANAKKG